MGTLKGHWYKLRTGFLRTPRHPRWEISRGLYLVQGPPANAPGSKIPVTTVPRYQVASNTSRKSCQCQGLERRMISNQSQSASRVEIFDTPGGCCYRRQTFYRRPSILLPSNDVSPTDCQVVHIVHSAVSSIRDLIFAEVRVQGHFLESCPSMQPVRVMKVLPWHCKS